jgi:spermidine/putrescine transport system substrate-binding protein
MRTSREISRRQLLRSAGVGFAGVSLAGLLAACGGDDGGGGGGAGPTGATGYDWAGQSVTGSLTFANWPLYIDREKRDGETVNPSLELFRKETGIEVDYREVIQDYASFYGRIQPQFAAGQSIGFDLIVMGFPKWLPLLINDGFLIPLDHSRLTTFAEHAADKYKDPSYDPGNRYTVPYMSGITGIGYNPELTGREITSVMDLFDPAFEGRVGMFGDTEDLPNLTLLGLGVEPSGSNPEDWEKAADLLRGQRDDGIVRQYYGQNYVGALTRGDVALTMAWSADILQLQFSGEPVRFVVPEEGGLLWTDSLCIPVGAAHPLDALTFMDFIYRPEVAAMIVGWIQNVSPVPESQDVLREQGATDVAESPLVFPTPDMYERLHGYRVLSPEEQQIWDQTFQPIYQG